MKIGDQVEEFCAANHAGENLCLSNIDVAWVLIHFYPKDLTPCCRREKLALKAKLKHLSKLAVVPLAIYEGDLARHAAMVMQYAMEYTMLHDKGSEIAKKFGVAGTKEYRGKSYVSIDKVGFLLDRQRKVAAVFNDFQLEFDVMRVVSWLDQTKS